MMPRFVLAFASCAALLSGQPGASFRLSAPVKSVSVIVLDETGSRDKLFAQALVFASRVVERIPAGGGLLVTAISDQSDREESVLFPLEFLPSNLTASVVRRQWVERIQGLSPRKTRRPVSDVVGAVQLARRLVPDGLRISIYFFSDMLETARALSPNDRRLSSLNFPAGTVAKAYLVNPGRSTTWEALVGSWLSVFQKIGVQIEKQDFCPLGNTAACVARDMAALRR
jgi:hypothetical protein